MAPMRRMLGTSVFLCAAVLSSVQAGKILVVPVEASHWINIKILMMELVQKGHELTVLRPSNSFYIEEYSEDFRVINVSMAENQAMSRDKFEKYALEFVFTIALSKHSSPFSLAWNFIQTVLSGTQIVSVAVSALFENNNIMNELRNTRFDLVLADPYNIAGPMLAHHLKLPMVFFGRWMPTEDIHFVTAPSPLSYVPVINSRQTDKMYFSERVTNVLLFSMYYVASHLLIYPVYDKLCQLYLHTDVGLLEMYKKADIYLMKVDFVFEFPRPIMPNAVYIGGFQCKPTKPLPHHLQQFMDGASQGVVVFSMVTLAKYLPYNIAREIAAGLARLPEKVIWRYSGEKLDTLGNNTLIADWIPQNDILGHPNTKAFLAHGGENGVYEAIYHGVPIVGIPLFDQFENILRLKTKGAAILLENLADINSEEIFSAVRLIIDDPSYGAAMKHLSKLHRDTPIAPLNAAVFWTEFTMRHGGAGHLQAVGNNLPWYQYYLLDVIAFLAFIAIICISLLYKFLKAIFRKCCSRKKKNKRD
uniref:UDP-glucuronosyltransferase n=1 Tax=Xenopus tropicalis TaxID=8364 RepID=A0A803JDQ4_XENTR